ncbi:hypothetical protein KYG_02447 [Acidovorax sp. NO-1]|uniref:hypothetical protein n=1 Tax=Acidovorax sp. NO-1 TaxID=512030 RepID=UPI00023FCDD9|nr:hypothetical protein [Acidovorax sp. NO-1]EHL24493.1 hypothetical protein KYG_02447 [Acidovorax sp. NO-1]
MHNTNNKFLSGRRVALCGVIAAVTLLAGCASLETGTPEEIVKARAEARWKAMVAHDFKRAYGYLAPSYRAVSSFERYNEKLNGGAAWAKVEVARVRCENAEKCTASVRIESKPIGVMNFKGNIITGVDETWLLEDGKWWLYQKL